jgi:hypothetical protein
MQLVRGIMLCKRTESERREEGESPKNQNGADDLKDKLHPVGRQGAGRDKDLTFAASEPAIASTGTMTRNLPHNIAKANVRLKKTVFALRPAKALPLVAAAEL